MQLPFWKGVLPVLIAAASFMNAAGADEALRSAPALLAENRPLVIAHRGYSMFAPENTIPAFRYALSSGADLIELDYYHSKDGIPVVFHDAVLDRTTDAREKWNAEKIRLETKTAEALQTLDAGKWFKQPMPGTKVPLLAEALDVIQKEGVTLIERKAGDPSTCIKMLRERDLINSVVVQAFDWNYLETFHKEEPRQILGALGPSSSYRGKKLTEEEKTLSPRWNDEVKRIGADLVVWNRNISREAVKDAHNKGLKVWVYTINEFAEAQRLLDLGVDGIITDNPSIVWKALALRPGKS